MAANFLEHSFGGFLFIEKVSPFMPTFGCTPRGRAATQRSKKGSQKVLERVLGKGSQKGSEKGSALGFTIKRGFWGRVLRRGSEKGVSRRCPERPLVEYAPLGMCPIPVTGR